MHRIHILLLCDRATVFILCETLLSSVPEKSGVPGGQTAHKMPNGSRNKKLVKECQSQSGYRQDCFAPLKLLAGLVQYSTWQDC